MKQTKKLVYQVTLTAEVVNFSFRCQGSTVNFMQLSGWPAGCSCIAGKGHVSNSSNAACQPMQPLTNVKCNIIVLYIMAISPVRVIFR